MGKPIEIVVGRGNVGDPVTGANQVVIPSLAGKDIFVGYQGYGLLKYEDYTVLPQGGFAFTNTARTFAINDAYFVYSTITSAPSTGNYSNGLQVAPILAALTSRLGWVQPTVAGAPVLSGPNTVSNSGRFFNDYSFHAIVDPTILKDCLPDPAITDIQFNAWLLQLQQAAILRALNGVFNKRELLEKKLMFERFGRQDYDDVKQANSTFVGCRITAPRSFDRSMFIDAIFPYFRDAQQLNFYLFHDTTPTTPLAILPVNIAGGGQNKVMLDQFHLNYSEVNASGYYYFGYFQEDVIGNAVNEILERFNECYEFGITPIELQVPAPYTINPNQVAFTIKTHGFNIQMSAYRDHTQAILSSPWIFDNLLGLQMAAMCMEIITNSIRSNKDERLTNERIGFIWKDLNLDQSKGEGDFQPQVAGLKYQIRQELKRVKEEFYPRPKIETNTHDTESFNPYGIPELDLFRY